MINSFYIGTYDGSGTEWKSKEEFLNYLSELIAEAEEKGQTTFDISID